MNLSEFSSCLTNNANDAKNLMSLLIGHYTQEEAAPAILALFENFPEDYKNQSKLFSPVFLKFFHIYGINDITYPYYLKWSKNYSSDTLKHIQDCNPDWTWDNDPKITFKNSLELSKALFKFQRSNYDHKNHMVNILPFFIEYESEINRLVIKDKNKLVENFQKHDVWKNLILDDYLFMKDFCQKYQIDVIDILKKNIDSKSGYGLCNYIAYSAMPTHQFAIMMEDIKTYGVDNFFENSNFLKHPQHTDSMSLGIAESILYALCYNKIEHASLIATTFEDKLTIFLPWKGDNPYDDKKWEEYCKDKKNQEYTSYGMQSHHFRCMSDELMSQIGSTLKTISLKIKIDNKIGNKPSKPFNKI